MKNASILAFSASLILSAQLAFASLKVATEALQWMTCPPKNPFLKNDSCLTQCCSGSNWDLTCIGFVESVAAKATGIADPQLLAGFPKPGQTYGSAVESYQAMKQVGRAHTNDSVVPAGAAVFFLIQGFAPGHIAIASGEVDANGSPMIVTTGGPTWGSGIRLESLSEMKSRPYWIYLGWADL